MIGKTPKEHQMSIFEVALESFIDMNHELVLLSKQIDWEALESEFAEYYCADNGSPSVPIRKMVGMLLLKNIYNLSDEGVVARWMENPYMQYFTGEKVFQKRPPMNPIDMTKFRKCIGTIGSEKIFKISLLVNAKEITAKELKLVMIDVINTLMAAAAYNMRHWMNKNALSSFVSWVKTVIKGLENVIFGNENQYAYQYLTLATVAKSGVWQA